MKESFNLETNREEKERLVESSESVDDKGSLIKKALKKLGITSALLASLTGGAVAQEKHTDDPFGKEKMPPISRESETMKSVQGEKYVGVKNMDSTIAGDLDSSLDSDTALVIQHNIKSPESLADIGKMLIEPMSISLSFPYGSGNIVAKVRTMLGYKDGETQIIDIDVPYKYSEKFDMADPTNQEEMKKRATEDAEKLFDQILTSVSGLSFFKKEAAEHHGEFMSPLTEVDSMKIEGYASPESADGVNMDSYRNQKLSKLRAENAEGIIRELFKDKNIGVDEVFYEGKGEASLSEEEMKRIAEEAVQLDLADPKNEQEKIVFDVIKKYNDGDITEESALKLLEETVGSKRKVAVHLELDEQKKILVLPLPILLTLPFIPIPRKRKSVPPHKFIRSEDPSKPTVRVPHFPQGGGVNYVETERLGIESNRFFAPYKPDEDRFFIVSSDDVNDLETANAYRLAAQSRDLEVIRPENTRGDENNITEGFVRIIKSLNVDPSKTNQELYEREFKNLIRLLNFGEDRIQEERTSGPDRRHIHILAFGQEETVVNALQRFFVEQGINNLEVLSLGAGRNSREAEANFRQQNNTVR